MTKLSVMTWNVENLFRPTEGAPQKDQERYQRKLTLIADIIGQNDPDILALLAADAIVILWFPSKLYNNPSIFTNAHLPIPLTSVSGVLKKVA